MIKNPCGDNSPKNPGKRVPQNPGGNWTENELARNSTNGKRCDRENVKTRTEISALFKSTNRFLAAILVLLGLYCGEFKSQQFWCKNQISDNNPIYSRKNQVNCNNNMESINANEGNSLPNTINNETSSATKGRSTLFSNLEERVTMDHFESSGQKTSDGKENGERMSASLKMTQNLDATRRTLLGGASQEDNDKAVERMEPISLFSIFVSTSKEAKDNAVADCSLAVGDLRSGSTQLDEELAENAMGQWTIANGSQTVTFKFAGSITSLTSDQSKEVIQAKEVKLVKK